MKKLKALNFIVFFLVFSFLFAFIFLVQGRDHKVYAAACPIPDGGTGVGGTDGDGVVNGIITISANTTWTADAVNLGSFDCSMYSIVVTGSGTTLTLVSYVSADTNWANDYGVTINAANITVNTGARISADGKGYSQQSGYPGPGVGSYGYWGGGGGGYGGAGGKAYDTGAVGGPSYGEVSDLTDLGSAGGNASAYGNVGGAGGGAIKLSVDGTITVDGTLSANGLCGSGGGSGGSVVVTGSSVAGSGQIQAAGATCYGDLGSGGGGRVEILYSSSYSPTLQIGIDGDGANNGTHKGTLGTAYVKNTLTNDLIIPVPNNTWRNTDFASWNFRDITINGNSSFYSSNANQLVINSTGQFTLANNVILSLGGSYTDNTNGTGVVLNLTGDVTIPVNSRISSDGLGYPGGAVGTTTGFGPGGGVNTNDAGGGGSYGGRGADSVPFTSIPAVYGSLENPVSLGSGGGAGWNNTPGGAGGGAIKIITTGKLTVNGTVSSNGVGYATDAGAGSGGSVLLIADSISGSGSITANGGTSNRIGGGGGRVVIKYSTLNDSVFTAVSAVKGSNGANATDGTAYIEEIVHHDITVPSNNGTWYGNQRTSWDFRNLTFNGNLTLQPTDLTTLIINSSGSTVIGANVNLYLKSSFTNDTNGVGVFLNLTGNITLPVSSNINANGFGYSGAIIGGAVAMGTGKGGNGAGGSGAGHGGIGGRTNYPITSVPGTTYGSASAPIDLGSGGGASSDVNGSNGGGLVKVWTTGTFEINGTIVANGVNAGGTGGQWRSGGGSGGSIWLRANIYQGTGTVAANGGNSDSEGGAGGGGRVKIDYTEANNFPVNNITANQGYRNNTNSELAGDGTVTYENVNAYPNVPSNLGGTEVVNGGYLGDATPTFAFDLSDPNAANTVKYQIQIASDSGFSTVVVDYTSALAAQGTFTFTVGQAVDGGAYINGSLMSLTESNYYWRVKTIDNSSASSAYTVANSGDIAFVLDLTGPSAPTWNTITTPTANNQPTWTWDIPTFSGAGLGNPAYTIQYSPDPTFVVTGTIATSNTNSFTPATQLADRRWYVRVRAVDVVGNPSAFSTTAFVDVDTTAPISSDNTDANWHTSGVTITIGCSDAIAGCATTYYTTDGNTPTTSSSQGNSIVLNNDGLYTIKYFSVDAVGNTEGVKTSANQVKVDATAPTTPGILLTITPSNSNHPQWGWNSSTDSTSGLANPAYTIEWSLQSDFGSGVSSATTNIATYTVSDNLIDGTWYFRAKSTDIAGNSSEYTANSSFLVDTTPPVLSVVNAVITPDNDTTPDFTFSSTETGTIGYLGSCSSASNTAVLGSTTVTFNALTDNTYSNCRLTVTDAVGNASLELVVPDFTIDTYAPDVAVSEVVLKKLSGDVNVSPEGWINGDPVRFEWKPGADSLGGVGLKGYCVNISNTLGALPEVSKGLLGVSPISTNNTPCEFVATPVVEGSVVTLDLSDSVTHGTPWLTSSTLLYYVNIKPVDNAGNVMVGDPVSFAFHYDDTAPTNIKYVSAPGGNFVNVADMNFTWPVGNALSASDDHAGLLGYQYQLNSLDPSGWKGADGLSADPYLGIGYILSTDSIYNLTVSQDAASVVLGDNTIYFRSVDLAGNYSSEGTYRTANISYGGEAPAFGVGANVTVNPHISSENKFTITWPVATAGNGNQVAGYYYMINTTPPSNLTTLQGNATAYISVGTNTSVTDVVLKNVNKGSNSVTVVAVDDHGNYSPGNKITGSFTLNSTNPDPVVGLFAADASVKEASLWRASLSWIEPVYKGTGELTYIIQRSDDGTTWVEVSRTAGLSYVDTVAHSQKYYWRIGTIDTSDSSKANPSFTNGVFVTPRGKYSSPAALVSGPIVTDISTKKVTVSWVTERNSDSRVIYGLESGKYFDVEAAVSTQLTAHSIKLINLAPGTSYFYKVLWTDEDGNIGQSDEKLFQTAPQPIVTNVKETDIGLFSATVSFTVTGANQVLVDYGKSSGYGQQSIINTSVNESSYTIKLGNLEDGAEYHYRISLLDMENSWYKMEDHIFNTLPRPRISNIRMQQVKNSASATVLISWNTNVEASSIISYSKDGEIGQQLESVDTKYIVNEHKMILTNLSQESTYILQVKARDRMGNEAVSDIQKFTTAIDTRPPTILDLAVEGEVAGQTVDGNGASSVQLVVSWSTDESTTAQVEFAEGAGTSYSSKTFEDKNLSTEHLVILPNLQPSKVYHLRVISRDKAGNETISYDVVTVTPKSSENALDIIFGSLKSVFN